MPKADSDVLDPPETPETPASDPRLPVIRVRAGTLGAALKDVTGVVAGRDVVPVLEMVLFEGGESALALETTDLDMWARRTLACEKADAGTRGFAVLIPAKALAAVIGQIDPDATVTIEGPGPDEVRVTIKAGRSRFRLSCLPAGEFPRPLPAEGGAGFDLPCSQLGDLFASVEHAISTEETRYYLNGVYLHPAALMLNAVATDGHRLARRTIDAPDGANSFPPSIVGRRAVVVLDKLLVGAIKAAGADGAAPTVTVSAEGAAGQFGQAARIRFAMAAADGGEVELLAKTVDGTFPDYTRVIPDTVESTARLDRAALVEAVKRVAVLAEVKTRIVKLEFEAAKLTLTVTSPVLGDAREELPCALVGEPVTLGLDCTYLLAALGATGAEMLALGMSGAGGPVRLRPIDPASGDELDQLVQVIMPARV